MNRKIIIPMCFMATHSIMNAQVAQWLIPPQYNNIQMETEEELIITDSLNKKVIWSLEGNRLASTEDQLFPFADGVAVTTKRESDVITGFFDKNGKFTPLPEIRMAYSMPYFSNGNLLVLENNYYRFVNSKGELCPGQYVKACPFANGYSSCYTYENLLKKKDPYNLLINKDGEQISFSYGGKQIKKEDIEFISSVNDENIGIVIAKHKLYYFNGKNISLSPVFPSKSETNLKNQAKLKDELPLCLSHESDSITILHAKCGKNGKIQIKFNSFLVPISISLIDGEYTYNKKIITKRSYESPLKIIKNENKCGICWGNKEILPPQLDRLITCFDDKAFVCLSGKCGMLKILKEEKFKITINKDNPIDFRHQKYDTTIRLDLPKIISAFNTRLEISPQSGCNVDMPSGEKKDTEFGNYIQYNCVLNIPDSLPDEMYGDSRNEILYPMQIIYDNLKSPVILIKVKAWHYKYFNVDVNDSETLINQGTLSFTFNINAERNPGEPVYPTSVQIQTDSLQCELEKISETRYKCKVLELKEGNNNIVVQILEDGCPPASFPFEVTYVKPTAKTRNKSARKEDVVIKKKTRKTQVSTSPIPHLDI